MNFEDIGSILSSLSDEDMANLSNAAQQLLGGNGGEKEKSEPAPDPLGGIDPQMISKIMQLMPLLQNSGDNDRTRLICALKPLLSPQRRQKADEAMQIMRLIDVLPMIGNIM